MEASRQVSSPKRACVACTQAMYGQQSRLQKYQKANVNKILTQQEERVLLKYVIRSADGSLKKVKGFEAAATRLHIPVATAMKRFGEDICMLLCT